MMKNTFTLNLTVTQLIEVADAIERTHRSEVYRYEGCFNTEGELLDTKICDVIRAQERLTDILVVRSLVHRKLTDWIERKFGYKIQRTPLDDLE